MEKLEQYESMLSTLKNIIKEEKALIKYREKRAGMSSCSPKELARLSDKQTNTAFNIKKLRDNLHAQIVDASLADPYDIEHYKGREITQSAGLGGTYTFLYIPKKPKNLPKGAKMSQVDILLDYLCKEIDDALNESDINLIRQEYIEKGLSDELVDTAINEAFELYLGDEKRV